MKTIWLKLLGISSTVWGYLAPILKAKAGDLLTQILPIAEQVVLEVAKTHDLPNAKRDAALADLRDRTRAVGIDAATSVLNLAVELALQSAKTKGHL